MLIYISMQLNTYNRDTRLAIHRYSKENVARSVLLHTHSLIFLQLIHSKGSFVSCSTHSQRPSGSHFLMPLALPLLPGSIPQQRSKGPLPGWSSGRQLGLVCCVLGAEKGLCHPGPGSGCYGSWPDTGKTLQVWNWAEVHSGRAGWVLRWKSFRTVSDSLGEAEMTCIIYWE